MLFSLDSSSMVAKNRGMNILAYGKTDVGRKRKINQDSVLISDKHHIYAVADGMGGHKGGEVASKMAIEALLESIGSNKGDRKAVEDKIETAYRLANDRIYNKSHDPGFKDLEGMGTTLVALVATEKRVFISNVGDSRAYLFRDNQLWQITEDHSLVQEQLRAGLIQNDENGEPKSTNSAPVVGKNVITRSVGFESFVKTDIVHRKYMPGEVYLLCSDGLSGLVSDHDIAEILKTHPLDKVPSVCINRANEAGGTDNVTCLVVSLK